MQVVVDCPTKPNATCAEVPRSGANNADTRTAASFVVAPLRFNCLPPLPLMFNCRIYLNPMNPFQDGAVSCTNVTRPLRVFYGESCQLWRANNAARCSWDALLQARSSVRPAAGRLLTLLLCLLLHH